MLKKGMQTIAPPPGLIVHARHKIESESRLRPFRFLTVSWKTVLPALSMAALVLVMLLNPFSGHLQTVDEVVTLSIANHLDTGMERIRDGLRHGDLIQTLIKNAFKTLFLPVKEGSGSYFSI
jgi:hypothetical protein